MFSPLPFLTGVVGVGVDLIDPLLDSPHGGAVGDVRDRRAGFGLARVEKGNHPALAVEDESARVALGAEWADRPIVVVDGDLDGPDAVVSAEERLETSAAADGEVGRGAIL
jgi:hypothetical protein